MIPRDSKKCVLAIVADGGAKCEKLCMLSWDRGRSFARVKFKPTSVLSALGLESPQWRGELVLREHCG